MLARVHRVIRPEDFRSAVRRGRRSSGRLLIMHTRVTTPDAPVRFGFIVSRAVGVAVVRNRVRRRLRAAAYEALPASGTGIDVVFRALPAAGSADWSSLREGVLDGLERTRVRA